jgi:hypothetical protein
MRDALTPDQAQNAEADFAAGKRRYGAEPFLVGQVRNDPVTGWELRAVPVPPKVGMAIKRLLDKALAELRATPRAVTATEPPRGVREPLPAPDPATVAAWDDGRLF